MTFIRFIKVKLYIDIYELVVFITTWLRSRKNNKHDIISLSSNYFRPCKLNAQIIWYVNYFKLIKFSRGGNDFFNRLKTFVHRVQIVYLLTVIFCRKVEIRNLYLDKATGGKNPLLPLVTFLKIQTHYVCIIMISPIQSFILLYCVHFGLLHHFNTNVGIEPFLSA